MTPLKNFPTHHPVMRSRKILKSTVSHPSVDLLKKVFDFAYNPKIRFYLKPFDKEDLDEEKFAILHLTAQK